LAVGGYIRILCCSILYRATLPPLAKLAPVTKIMDEALRWLNQHLAEDVSINRLVAFMGYSRARLFSLFKAPVGYAPNDYLQRLRILKTKALLASGTLAEKDMAIACGFKTTSYFIRVFRRQTGLTPLGYRAKFRKDQTLSRQTRSSVAARARSSDSARMPSVAPGALSAPSEEMAPSSRASASERPLKSAVSTPAQ